MSGHRTGFWSRLAWAVVVVMTVAAICSVLTIADAMMPIPEQP